MISDISREDWERIIWALVSVTWADDEHCQPYDPKDRALAERLAKELGLGDDLHFPDKYETKMESGP